LRNAAFILAILAVSLFALHEEQTAPARMLGMGGTVAAVGNSTADVPFNPAISAGIERISLSATYSSRWQLEGFREYSAVFAYPTEFANLALYWHERSVPDVYGERTAALNIAKTFWDDVHLGLTAKLLMTSADGAETWNDPAYNGPVLTPCADFGVIYTPFEKWRFGLTTRSFGAPEVKLLETSTEGEKLGRQLAMGTSWEVAPDLILAMDVLSDEGNLQKWTPRIGMEITFFETVALRAGAKGERLGMGAGLKSDRWSFDFGLQNHRWLGNTYRFTLNLNY